MPLARTMTTAIEGVGARIVAVEANTGPGLPGTHIVGMGDTTVRESRHRLRTAVANSQLRWPRTKIVVSLSPADVPKRGSHADLAMCLAILAATDPRAAEQLHDTLILGELGLSGEILPVPGVVPAVSAAGKKRPAPGHRARRQRRGSRAHFHRGDLRRPYAAGGVALGAGRRRAV
ncbi:magnesium chelatase domain-containing protein [Corynebacterium yudongzhengii]|uniref:magnesium chelatase domain-containing protein n=1 Tax=Corynebacterium yudongzhengii TaxID=2080740 RepID=UPI002E25FABF